MDVVGKKLGMGEAILSIKRWAIAVFAIGILTGCTDPCGYGYGAPVVAGAYAPAPGAGRGFALIVVLFILLIIVGASKFGHC